MQEPVLITIPLPIPLRIINNQDKITQINLTLISSISSSNIKVNFLRISPSTLTLNLLEVPKEDSKLLVWILIIFWMISRAWCRQFLIWWTTILPTYKWISIEILFNSPKEVRSNLHKTLIKLIMYLESSTMMMKKRN